MAVAPNAAEVEGFIGGFTGRLAPVEKAVSEAWWVLATTGTEEAQEESVRAGMEYNRLFADPGEFERVRGWYEGRGSLGGSALGRQVEVLYRAFADRQGDEETLRRIEELEAEANAVYGNHRGVVGGEPKGDNELRRVLRLSDDEASRREAWEASKSVGVEVEPVVRELARLRNRLAKEQGYENHYLRSLDLQEIEPAELDRIMDGLEAATDAPFRRFKAGLDGGLKERFGVARVMPWHLSDPFFQEPPEVPGFDADRPFRGKDLEAMTRATYDAMGLEVRDVLARSDLYERPGKDQHAFCTRIGRDYPYDVRVLANVRADAYWMDTMLHEFGHAVYDKNIDPSLPYLLRTYAHTSTTEAIALMMGGLSDEPLWISRFAGVPEADLDAERLAARRRADGLVFTRWALVMYHFEKAFYADPDREDLNDLWWDLVGRLQLVERPPDRDEPDWAAKIHVAVAPVYYHNYVLGHLTAAQLRRHVEEDVVGGPIYGSELAGRYLQEAVFGPGARDDWRTTVLRATGEHLNPRYFVESLG
jgi:peptidyl-dipeptidase A